MTQQEETLDLENTCAQFIHGPFGGGWIVPLTDEGHEALAEYYGEPAAPIAPLGDVLGYIVEPYVTVDLAEYFMREGLAWELA